MPTPAADTADSQEIVVTVSADGEVETVAVDVELSDEAYAGLEVLIHGSVAEHLAELMQDDSPDVLGAYTVEEREIDDGHAIDIEFTDVDVSESDSMSISMDGETVTREQVGEDRDEEEESLSDEVRWTVVMPDDIEESNAHEVDDEVAT